jgi:hypothetical protein
MLLALTQHKKTNTIKYNESAPNNAGQNTLVVVVVVVVVVVH